MHVAASFTAENVDISNVNDLYCTIIDSSGAISIIGSHADRLTFIARWIAEELFAADLDNHEVLEALQALVGPIADALDCRVVPLDPGPAQEAMRNWFWATSFA